MSGDCDRDHRYFIRRCYPKFINLSSNAQTAATTAIAGALSAANASNYAARKLSSSLGVASTKKHQPFSALQGGLPTAYTITSANVALILMSHAHSPALTLPLRRLRQRYFLIFP